MAKCYLCPRMCGVDRSVARGFCGMGEAPVIARAALHRWEEPCISGTRGSGTVFFSGCTLRCIFCQNHAISREGLGVEVSEGYLRAAFERLIGEGAHNINLVTPTHFLPAILRALEQPLSVPVVMNTGGYERVETLRRLEGRMDIYLPDLKYADDELGRRLSGAPDYFTHASRALIEMARQVGAPRYDAEGMMTRGMIVRHLVLPGHLGNTFRALRFIKSELPAGTPVSLMAQYTPCVETPYRALNRRLSRLEYDTVVNEMIRLGLSDGYVQELESADAEFIPPFEKLEI
ncbi:MAG: radical SAM protein [Candidatus Fimadaptatus sp.]